MVDGINDAFQRSVEASKRLPPSDDVVKEAQKAKENPPVSDNSAGDTVSPSTNPDTDMGGTYNKRGKKQKTSEKKPSQKKPGNDKPKTQGHNNNAPGPGFIEYG